MGEKTIVLSKRVLTALGLAVIGIPAIIVGGYFYFALIMLFLGVAAWEYGRLFGRMDCKVSEVLLIAGVVVVATARIYFPDLAATVLTLFILACMTWHLLEYERGRDRAASDFAATTVGILYLGWIGAYMITLRNLPDGLWWLLTVLPTIWLADMAAFFVGIRFGRHLSARASVPRRPGRGIGRGLFLVRSAASGWSSCGTALEVRRWHGGTGRRWARCFPS
jgi:phosphatidate cytidylyltransferase